MQSDQAPTLYDRLGGVYNIATVVDDLIDRVMTDPRLNKNPAVDEAHHRVSPAGFKFLVNRDGKVHTASFQSAVYEGDSFYVIAPYTSHAVVRDVVCDDCHDSAALNEYNETGEINVARWDEETGTLIGPTGVIPIPPDWETALIFDYLDYDVETDTWSFLKTGTDLPQMMYAEPLTEEQMGKLGS